AIPSVARQPWLASVRAMSANRRQWQRTMERLARDDSGTIAYLHRPGKTPRTPAGLRLAFGGRTRSSSAMSRLRRVMICLVVLIGATALASETRDTPFPPALSINPFAGSDPYQDCVAAIAKKADDAFEMALSWRDHGGGVAAEHCAALALLSLDELGEAASRLDALAQRPDAGTAEQRAALLGQAGNAWLLANQPENAETAFSTALRLTAQDSELWVDRARARAARQDWANAEADLNTAIGLDKS